MTCNVGDGKEITNDPMTTMRSKLLIQHTKQACGFLRVTLSAVGFGMLWLCVMEEREREIGKE